VLRVVLCSCLLPAKKIHIETVNTKDHGVPQDRPRMYMVGVRSDSLRADYKIASVFPPPLIQPLLTSFLDERSCEPVIDTATQCRTFKHNIRAVPNLVTLFAMGGRRISNLVTFAKLNKTGELSNLVCQEGSATSI
jgi:site-specific DNA-cytosine methylase